jgi:hypothetical protein
LLIDAVFHFLNRFYPVKPTDNILSAFQQLDIASEYVKRLTLAFVHSTMNELILFVFNRRDNYTIGVLYIRSGRKSEKEIFSVEPSEVTKEYHDFLSNLGWEVRFTELLID